MPLKTFKLPVPRFSIPKFPAQGFSLSSAKTFLSYAFGLTEKPAPHAILEVGSKTLRILECMREDGTLRLLGYHLKEVPPQNLAVPAQEELLRKGLGAFLEEVHLLAKKVTLGFSSGLILVRKITVPEMPKEELPRAIRWAIRTQLPFDAEQAALAFEVTPPKEKKQEILLAVADSSRLASWVTLIHEKGLRVVELTSTPLALLQWLKGSGFFSTEAVALLDIGTFHTSLFVFAVGKPLFVRELPLGGESVTRAMTQQLSTEKGEVLLTPEEAERLKRTYGFPSEEIQGEQVSCAQLVSLIRPVLERLAGELRRSLDYFREESNLPLKRLFLVGGGCQLKGLDRFLEGKLGLSVEQLSLPFRTFFPQGHPSEGTFVTNFPIWATTLTLAAKGTSVPFDLLPAQFREKKGERIERATVRLTAFALSLILLILFLFKGLQIQVLEKENQVLQAHWRTVQEIETLQGKIRERRVLANQLLQGHPFFVGALKEISQSLSANAVLDRLDYNPTDQSLLLSGTIFGTATKPTEGLLGDLISRLEKSPFFKGVDLISSERDDTYDQQASNFQIQCELVIP